MAIYDNVSKDEKVALKIHQAVLNNRISDFRNNCVVVKRIKKALYGILNNKDKVEQIYKIIEKQDEY